MKVHHITSQKYEHELMETIRSDGGMHVYDIGNELSRLFKYAEYNESNDGYGSVKWLACETKLPNDRLKDEIRKYLPTGRSAGA